MIPSTTVVAAGSVAVGSYAQGRDIYNYRCYFCHGYSGDARTLASSYLTPAPRDFTSTELADLSRETMIMAVTQGRPGTAMTPFSELLSRQEIGRVVDFIRQEFMAGTQRNTRYHTPANGWPGHERYRSAFPFATGELAIDYPWSELTPEQQRGRRLFMASCITCHDRARVTAEGVPWEGRSVSFPRAGYSHKAPTDSLTGATPFARHDIAPQPGELSLQGREGEMLFQANCAFCHGADGSGKNWIGSFLKPHPRDLTDPVAMMEMSAERLQKVIRDGLPETTMPAWKGVLSAQQIKAVTAYVMEVFVPQGGVGTRP